MTHLKSKLISFFTNLGLKFMNEDLKISYMILNCRPSQISEIVIVPIVKFIINKFKNNLSNVSMHGITYKGKYNGKVISIVPATMGAPAAAVLMEALNKTKAKYILKVDYCGGLTPDINIGDILVADKAICGDGTTTHYNNNLKFIESDPDLLFGLQKFFDQKKIKFKTGPIYTTDAIFRETEELLNEAKKLGAISIDMETSILYLLGKLYDKKVISINIVSDKPDPKKKFDLKINSQLIDNMELLVKSVLEFVSGFS
ncbi:MAG: phosphorylase family protein [Candidatus Helarchaeota archaeon]